ncbi:hypothetical protein EYF80_011218 [Liparis tanakae]|uniref:Uncharacterized protein n=1 Tax=Liparis tanakae TaxID=230148 RepID=A0A4Z2IN90_9TELE|nr:hypothetical protein EYF80_011218 [Liparis tanakae]
MALRLRATFSLYFPSRRTVRRSASQFTRSSADKDVKKGASPSADGSNNTALYAPDSATAIRSQACLMGQEHEEYGEATNNDFTDIAAFVDFLSHNLNVPSGLSVTLPFT